jgi:rhodanese-related sulfurtransferase
MLANKDFTLVNVHIPFRGYQGPTLYHIMKYRRIWINSDQNAKIFLYCRSGRMSDIAAEELVSLGYTNIWMLPGGMLSGKAV